jgi:hypothetical protein
MESGRWRFPKLNHQHDELVSRLLKSLEKIVSMDKSTIAEVTSSFFKLLYNISRNSNMRLRNLHRPPFLAWKH